METHLHKLSPIRVFGVLYILLFTNFYSIGQFRVVTKTFQKHFSICHFNYTAYEDYLLELFSDFTIEISIYNYSSDKHGSINLVRYSGTYSVKGDNLEVAYGNIAGEMKFGTPIGKTFLKPPIPGKITLYPSPFFILRDSSIVSANNFFPPLHASNVAEANQLKHTFYMWDKHATISDSNRLAVMNSHLFNAAR